MIPILILAAGASSRMRGGDKLLEDVGGRPLLRERVEAALATGAPVVVTLPAKDRAPARWSALDGLEITRATLAQPDAGLSASLACGVAALPGHAAGVMIMLADMPDIAQKDMQAMLGAWDGTSILRGADDGDTPGHPVIFPTGDFAALQRLTGDQGARAVIRSAPERVKTFRLPDGHATTDLDTPEAWAAWRAKRR